jgi:hypothetical protein
MLRSFKKHLFKIAICSTIFFQISHALAACSDEKSSVDQSIVLAIDISFSVNKEEMAHQMSGFGSAFFDSKSRDNLLGCGCTEVTVLFWGGAAKVALETKKIRNDEDLLFVKNFFSRVQQMSLKDIQEKYRTGYITNVGSALKESSKYLLNSENTAFRKIIIISGDGPHNSNSFPKKDFDVLKQNFIYEGVSVYAIPISVYEDTADGVSKKLNRQLGQEPKSYYTKEEVEKQLSKTPDFYRKHVITRPNYMHVSTSFLDMQRAMTKTLQSMQCLMM